MRPPLFARLATALAVVCVLGTASAIGAAPVVRSASIRITVTSPTRCEVSMALTVDGAQQVDHRIEAFDGSRVDLVHVDGAQWIDDVGTIGRTRSLVLHPDQATYSIRYRATQPVDRSGRCPLWLPAVPTDGQSRTVRLDVLLPPGTLPGRSMPALIWTGTAGSTTLGHVPAFVYLSYAAPGDIPDWDIGRVMDGVAVLVLVLASAVWIWRRKQH